MPSSKSTPRKERRRSMTASSAKKARRITGTFEVDHIVDSRTQNGETEYRVRWEGFGPGDDTYEPAQHLNKCWQLVEEYEAGLKKVVLVKKEESPVKAKKSPVKAKKSPVKAEKSRVKAEKSPVKAEKSPVKAKKSPVKAKKSPVKAKKSPVKAEKSPVKAKKSPVKSNKSPIKAKKSPVKSNKSPIKAKKSPVKAKKSPVKSKKSSIKAEKSAVGVKAEKLPVKANTPPKSHKKTVTSRRARSEVRPSKVQSSAIRKRRPTTPVRGGGYISSTPLARSPIKRSRMDFDSTTVSKSSTFSSVVNDLDYEKRKNANLKASVNSRTALRNLRDELELVRRSPAPARTSVATGRTRPITTTTKTTATTSSNNKNWCAVM